MKRKKAAPPKVIVLSAQAAPAKGTQELTRSRKARPLEVPRVKAAPGLVRRSAPAPKPTAPRGPLQALIERTVKLLLLTATVDGDLTFRADVRSDVMSDLSVDVGLFGRQVVVTFYTTDDNTRRLLSGHERELRAVLESRGLKVHRIVVQREVDPDEPPPVPVFRNE